MKVVLMNKERCEKDIDSRWGIGNMGILLENLAQLTINEFAEGASFNLLYSSYGGEKRPAGAFKVIELDFYVIKLEYLGLEFV